MSFLVLLAFVVTHVKYCNKQFFLQHFVIFNMGWVFYSVFNQGLLLVYPHEISVIQIQQLYNYRSIFGFSCSCSFYFTAISKRNSSKEKSGSQIKSKYFSPVLSFFQKLIFNKYRCIRILARIKNMDCFHSKKQVNGLINFVSISSKLPSRKSTVC